MKLFLGIDASTQGIKAELIDIAEGTVVNSAGINFGQDLPEYRSPNGFIEDPDPLVKTADPLMWVAALELLLEKMKNSGAPMSEIEGISGSGQQHGTVYLNERFNDILRHLDVKEKLPEQLRPALSRQRSPIWMDRSTTTECRELMERFGERMQTDTGSPAVERFSGPQIRRWSKSETEAYQKTMHIHLVSSFMCSVLCGESAPIDYGDGAGMNLLNLKTLQWDREVAEFTAPGLIGKLPDSVASDRIAGKLSAYFSKFGLRPGIPVAVWSGDNPNSLIGVGAGSPGTAVISLGTSDTFFAAMRNFKTDPAGYGHIFGNPAGNFMSLICFTNGSLAREKVKDSCGITDWKEFDRLAMESQPGNNGKLMLPYFEAESTPLVLEPEVKYNFTDATDAEKVRAILESQALSMKLHSAWQNEEFKRIRITGGASASRAFRQILADVFQAEIESIAVKNSAGLGAALRAANSITGTSFETLYGKFCKTIESITPDEKNAARYEESLEDYEGFENSTNKK